MNTGAGSPRSKDRGKPAIRMAARHRQRARARRSTPARAPMPARAVVAAWVIALVPTGGMVWYAAAQLSSGQVARIPLLLVLLSLTMVLGAAWITAAWWRERHQRRHLRRAVRERRLGRPAAGRRGRCGHHWHRVPAQPCFRFGSRRGPRDGEPAAGPDR